MSDDNQSSFQGWAKVEVMGHQSHIGYVKTEAYGAAVLFRIDSPGAPEREYVLESPQYAEISSSPGTRQYCPTGTTVKRKERPPVSVLVGAGSIYRIIPCTEGAALKAIESEQRSELMLVALPAHAALPSPQDGDSQDDSDRCEGCNRPLEICDCPI